MRLCQMSVRALMVTACAILFASFAQGQTAAPPPVSVSPLVLNFGVPGTVTGTPSAVQQVTVAISQGSLPVTISFGSLNGVNFASDYSETDTCGVTPANPNPVAAPGCVINVTFTPHSSAGTKELATMNVTAGPAGTPNSFTVNLNGSLGSILLFNPVNVGASSANVTTTLTTFNNTTLALSCPASFTGTLSSSPDGGGNVLVDNFITLREGANLQPQTNEGSLLGNVCPVIQGGPQDGGQPDCFTSAYQGPAGQNHLNGVNPDTIANAGNTNSFLNGAAAGVPPIPVSGSGFTNPTNPTITISMLDNGGIETGSSLFLVTSCIPNGVAAGDTVTGNKVVQNDPTTLTQSFIFDSVNKQNSQFTSNTAANPDVAPPGTQPQFQVFPIPQQLFNQLVSGTSAAPGVCVRLNSVIDQFGATMCEGFLAQCWNADHTVLSGDNCTPNPAAARNLFDFAGYDSTDAPPGQDYLANLGTAVGGVTTSTSVCGGVATNCAQNVIGNTGAAGAASTMLVGPGLLLGGDEWLCAATTTPAAAAGCPSQANLTSKSTGTQYATANCVLTGSLTGDPCPMNPLTQFKGASDPTHGITTSGKNSIFVPVVNIPLPFTQTTIPGRNTNGWTQMAQPEASFTSYQANYLPQPGNPGNPNPVNFVAVPPYSVTYGIAKASAPAPDTTFAVSGDLTNYNPTGTNPNFGAPAVTGSPFLPLCNSNPGPPMTFVAPSSFTSSSVPLALAVAGGIYDLHYFTTDCALSEELIFQPTSGQLTDATANWASFRTIAFGVDNTPPTLSCPAPTPVTNGWYTSAPIVMCTASDDANGTALGKASGFAPGSPAPNTGCNSAISTDCNVLVGQPDPPATTAPVTNSGANSGANALIQQQTVTDLAGNVSNIQGPYNTPIDSTAPTFTAKFSVSGTTFNVGQSVTGTFTCGDAGSGVAVCGPQTVSACTPTTTSITGAPVGMGLPSFNTPVLIDTSASAVGKHVVNAVDCAGNPSPTSATYTVALGSADLGIGNIPNPLASVKNGSNLTYNIFVLNLSGNLATSVVVTNPIPANTTYVSAMSGIVSCTLAGCNNLATGSACTPTFNGSVVTSVTCTTPSLKSFLPGLTGYVVKLVVNVKGPTSLKSVTDTATVSEANPDPVKGDNTFTVTTKVTQ
jgi:uncharacterized repeat protein (TIGR01451 family)